MSGIAPDTTKKEQKMKLNKAQKIILVVYALIVLLLCIYVPWIENLGTGANGYSVIWRRPDSLGITFIDFFRIGVELFGLTVAFGSLFLIFKE